MVGLTVVMNSPPSPERVRLVEHRTVRMPSPSRTIVGAALVGVLSLPLSAQAAEPTATASFELVPEPAPTRAAFPAPPPPSAPPPSAPPPSAPPSAAAQVAPRVPQRMAETRAAPANAPRDTGSTETPGANASDDWMLSLEGVTRIPVDVGVQTIFETPVGLRFGGGYGFIPGPYVDFVTGAASGTASSTSAAADLSIFDGGHVWRAQLGIRPVRKLGFYLDGGYARVTLTGQIDESAFGGLPGAANFGAQGVTSHLDMWFAELGYQGHVGDHVVLGIGLGIMGTLDSSTELDQPSANSTTQALTAEATDSVDRQIERYGFIPNLSLRLGFDLI